MLPLLDWTQLKPLWQGLVALLQSFVPQRTGTGVADGPGVFEINGVTVGVLLIKGVTVGVFDIGGVIVGVGVRVGLGVGVGVLVMSGVGVGVFDGIGVEDGMISFEPILAPHSALPAGLTKRTQTFRLPVAEASVQLAVVA